MDDSLGGPESHCEGTVRYVHGPWAPLDGHFRYSKCVALPPGLVLESEAGTVLIKDGLDEAITLIPRDRPDLRLAISAAVPAVDLSLSPNQRMLRDFVRACAERRPPEVDGRQGLELMRLVRRFYENRHGMDLAWTTEGRRA